MGDRGRTWRMCEAGLLEYRGSMSRRVPLPLPAFKYSEGILSVRTCWACQIQAVSRRERNLAARGARAWALRAQWAARRLIRYGIRSGCGLIAPNFRASQQAALS
eukprot:1765328-Pyramimonas_sp.AAC.1